MLAERRPRHERLVHADTPAQVKRLQPGQSPALHGIRHETTGVRAAQIDGASLPSIYLRIILPSLRPVFFSALMILAHIAIKAFDLVAAMTAGGPGYASDLPAMFMYTHTFTRGQMGLGAASAILMLGAVMAIVVPYLYSELRNKRHD